MSPDRQQPARVSKIGRVFVIEDNAFNHYMGLRRTSKSSVTTFLNLSQEMAQHTNPLVIYASAWAAAEAGMFRERIHDSGRRFPFQRRIEALDTARILWSKAGEALKEARRRTIDPDVSADLLGFELRSIQALAYLPSMQLVAATLSDESTSGTDKEESFQQTRKQVTEFGETVIDLPGSDKFFLSRRSGMCNEILSGLLLQGDLRSIIIPASVRQDNNKYDNFRADLVAVATDAPHPKTLI